MKFLSILLTVVGAFVFTKPLFAQNGVGVNTNTPKSSFETNGSVGKKVTTVTASTTLDDTYGSIVCNNGATAITVTLPVASACTARIYEIKRNITSTNTVTISVSGGGTIDGASSFILNNAGQSVTVFSDGSVWLKRDGSNPSTDWTITGNAGTAAGTNFLGTTDNVDLVFRTNNIERARITSATVGSLGVGTATPFVYGRIAIVSNNNGRGREDDLGVAGFSTSATSGKSNGASPSLNFFSSRGSEASPSNVISGDDIFSILGKGTINGTLNTTTSSIVSEYKGSGTNNLSNLLFTTSGTQKAIIDENGNVGIATGTPTSRLHVVGSDAQTSNYPGTLLTNTATSSTSNINKKGLEVTSIGSWTGTSANNIGIHVSSVSGGTNNYDAIFNGGGNVGIGTNNPGTKLEVVANSSGANTITSINTSSSGYSSVDYKDNSSNLKFTVGYANGSAANFAGKAYSNTYGSDFILSKNAPSTDFFMNGSSGNIGIGNNSPQQNLSVQNGMNIDQAGTNNGTTTNTLTFGSSSGEGIGSKRTASGNQYGLDFYTASTNRMVITNTGFVGVNTTAPTSFLHVRENTSGTGGKTVPLIIQNRHEVIDAEVGIRLAPTNSEGVRGAELSAINRNGTNSIDMKFLTCDGGAGILEKMRLTAEGDLGIKIATPTSRLHVIADGVKTANYAGAFMSNIATSPNASVTKKGLEITSTGAWGGATTTNIGLHISSVSGATTNYDAIFNGGGNVGVATATPNSTLEVSGSFAANVNTITTSPTLDATHHIVIVTAGTITLPAAAAGNNKRIYHIANKTAGAITIGNYLNMTSPGTGVSNTIAAGIGISLVSNGTNWIQFR